LTFPGPRAASLATPSGDVHEGWGNRAERLLGPATINSKEDEKMANKLTLSEIHSILAVSQVGELTVGQLNDIYNAVHETGRWRVADSDVGSPQDTRLADVFPPAPRIDLSAPIAEQLESARKILTSPTVTGKLSRLSADARGRLEYAWNAIRVAEAKIAKSDHEDASHWADRALTLATDLQAELEK
jgi:hypothetical protein